MRKQRNNYRPLQNSIAIYFFRILALKYAYKGKVEGKVIPLQARCGPEGG